MPIGPGADRPGRRSSGRAVGRAATRYRWTMVFRGATGSVAARAARRRPVLTGVTSRSRRPSTARREPSGRLSIVRRPAIRQGPVRRHRSSPRSIGCSCRSSPWSARAWPARPMPCSPGTERRPSSSCQRDEIVDTLIARSRPWPREQLVSRGHVGRRAPRAGGRAPHAARPRAQRRPGRAHRPAGRPGPRRRDVAAGRGLVERMGEVAATIWRSHRRRLRRPLARPPPSCRGPRRRAGRPPRHPDGGDRRRIDAAARGHRAGHGGPLLRALRRPRRQPGPANGRLVGGGPDATGRSSAGRARLRLGCRPDTACADRGRGAPRRSGRR